MQALDGRGVEAVPVPYPLRHEMHDVAAEHLEGPADDDRGRDAVDVVVAVDGDPLARARSAADSRSTATPMSVRQHGVVQVAEAGVQEAIGLVRIGEAAHDQEAGDHRVEPEGRGQPRRQPPRRTRGAPSGRAPSARTGPAARGGGAPAPASVSAKSAPSRPMFLNRW